MKKCQFALFPDLAFVLSLVAAQDCKSMPSKVWQIELNNGCAPCCTRTWRSWLLGPHSRENSKWLESLAQIWSKMRSRVTFESIWGHFGVHLPDYPKDPAVLKMLPRSKFICVVNYTANWFTMATHPALTPFFLGFAGTFPSKRGSERSKYGGHSKNTTAW